MHSEQFTKEPIKEAHKEGEAGTSTRVLCRRNRVSDQSYCRWCR